MLRILGGQQLVETQVAQVEAIAKTPWLTHLGGGGLAVKTVLPPRRRVMTERSIASNSSTHQA
ncbi:MAG: hypothetical protein KDB23_22160 [Planctomycetales bacterium]|nr:hypothetical protein [Planctomycetales bacterium]